MKKISRTIEFKNYDLVCYNLDTKQLENISIETPYEISEIKIAGNARIIEAIPKETHQKKYEISLEDFLSVAKEVKKNKGDLAENV